MIGLFLPRLRVVSSLRRQLSISVAGPNRPAQSTVCIGRNRPPALTCNNEQDGGADVSARI